MNKTTKEGGRFSGEASFSSYAIKLLLKGQSREWWSPVGQFSGGRLSPAAASPKSKGSTPDNASIVAQTPSPWQR